MTVFNVPIGMASTNPSKTRREIIDTAFRMIYADGFHATSVNKIINNVSVTKGAFFHHFKSKDDMLKAVIQEAVAPIITESLVLPALNGKDPLTSVFDTLEKTLGESDFDSGCPLGNLVADAGREYSDELSTLLSVWISALENEFESAANDGLLVESAEPRSIAVFVVSSFEGVMMLGRVLPREELSEVFSRELRRYLNSVRTNQAQ